GAGPASRPPDVVLERTSEDSRQSYALVPTRLALASRPDMGLLWGVPGDTEIIGRDGTLWLRGGGLAPGALVPFVPGLQLVVEGLAVTVSRIDPESGSTDGERGA